MKCIHVTKFGGSDVLSVNSDVPKPTPSDDEVLVRVRAIGVNPVDTYIRDGNFRMVTPKIPFIPSEDIAGEIVEIGNKVKSALVKGQRIFGFIPACYGGAAEFATVPSGTCGVLPKEVSFDQGAAIGVPYLTAYHALFGFGQMEIGDKVLIHGGSGGVGMAAIDLAVSMGLDVYATASTEQGLDAMKKKGVTKVFNHSTPGYTDEIMKSTGNTGINRILEMLANVNFNKDMELLCESGKLMIIGAHGHVKSFDPFGMMLKGISVHGIALLSVKQETLHRYVKETERLLAEGKINPVVAKTYQFQDVRQLHDDLMSTKGKHGKLVLSVD